MDWIGVLLGYFQYLIEEAWDFVSDNFYRIFVICGFLYIAFQLQHIVNLLSVIAAAIMTNRNQADLN